MEQSADHTLPLPLAEMSVSGIATTRVPTEHSLWRNGAYPLWIITTASMGSAAQRKAFLILAFSGLPVYDWLPKPLILNWSLLFRKPLPCTQRLKFLMPPGYSSLGIWGKPGVGERLGMVRAKFSHLAAGNW